ncbi:MAG: hypothetical protein KC493_16595 [Bacteriovoracaceae bacterium]|nr:hypothetical protein [Bacteriovoracaceae bacterium]
MKSKLLKFLPLLLILVACESDPYPQSGGKIVNGRKPIQRDTAPAFSIDVASTMRFREGIESMYPVKFYVPKGTADYSFVGLPDGMEFDETRKKLVYKPGFFDANDPQDHMVKLKRIPVTIWLREKGNTTVAIKKDIVVEIVDNPRGFAITGSVNNANIDEGEEFERSFEFINEDFPNGDFSVKTINLPKEFDVTVSGNQVTMKMKPDFYYVSVSDSCNYWSCYREWDEGKIEIIAPDGRRLVQDIELKVNDERQTPKFVIPDEIEQGIEVSFIVSAMDQNAEVQPIITLKNQPRDGSITFERLNTKLNKTELKQTHMKFNWKDIPDSRRGTTAEFRFEACVYNKSRAMSNCKTKSVEVKISEQTHSAPVITRDEWPLAHINYLALKERKTFPLQVKDGDSDSRSMGSVKIYPEAMRSMVKFERGKLVLTANKEGLHQFKVVARSIFGIETSESFTFEALPKDWSKNLNLIGSLRSNEVVANRKLIESLDLANPDFQELNTRLLSARNTLVLGTDILSNPDQLTNVEGLREKFKNIVIMSSVIPLLKGEMDAEIKKLGISYRGRFLDVLQGQNLADYYFLIGKDVDLTYPKRRIKLNGLLTKESHNPLLLNKRINSTCTSALSLGDDVTGLDHLVSVKCRRENGGYLLINGFEFGDMKTSTDDQEIPKSWLNKLMEL